MLVIAETPKFKSVEIVHFPRLFASTIEYFGNRQSVYKQPAADIGEIKLFAVMGAKHVFVLVEMFAQQCRKSSENHFLIVAAERFHTKMPFAVFSNDEPG